MPKMNIMTEKGQDLSGKSNLLALMLIGIVLVLLGLYYILKHDPIGGPLLIVIGIPPLYLGLKLRRKLK